MRTNKIFKHNNPDKELLDFPIVCRNKTSDMIVYFLVKNLEQF